MAAKLLIIDDHPIVREGLKAFLGLQADLEVVGEAGSAREGLEIARATSPDLVLLDVQLPDGNGLAILSDLLALSPKPRVLILTSFADEAYIREAMRKGASGFLLKHAGPKRLLDSVRAALRGEMPLDASAVQVLARPDDDPLQSLTPRESDVLGGIAAGLSNRQIAADLGIAEKTVKTHATSLFAKLGVRDRTQAALYAKARGW